MMDDGLEWQSWIDGVPAPREELTALAFAGYAHFTALQVRRRMVRGFDLHLQRLRSASLALFGQAMPDDLVAEQIARAIDSGPDNMSLVATMYPRTGEFTACIGVDDPHLLVRTGPPTDGPVGPLALDLVLHERWRPEIKHVGEAAKTFFLRRAVDRGFDDVAFIDSTGRLGEASIWNLAFWDGDTVIWPRANVLNGITMGIVRRQLAKLGIAQEERTVASDQLQHVTGAAVMNSWTPGLPVSQLGDHRFSRSDELARTLRRAYEREPEQRVGVAASA
jgi:branched-subunit amino acid aminotransferase/4-amino-4-deoxychorismate lyase